MIWTLVIAGITGACTGLLAFGIMFLVFKKSASSDVKNNIHKNVFDENKTKNKASGEIAAAVAISIYLNDQLYSKQKKLLTMQKVTEPFSPWVNSGKVIMLNDWNDVYNRKK